MTTVLITGGTGMIGPALTRILLENNYSVKILTRDPDRFKPRPGLRYHYWDPEKKKIDPAAIENTDHIINLAGAGIADKRWTRKRKDLIQNSRIQAGETIVWALQTISNRVSSVINASAIGWYGESKAAPAANPKVFIETDPPHDDFLGETCRLWESAIEPVTALNIRLVKFRIGIVLSREGGALKEFLKPLKFGLATILGTGKQIQSWIHINDLAALFLFAISHTRVVGVFNAVAPHPVTNRELILTMARARNRFYIPFRVPGFLIKMVFGELSIEVLKTAEVSSAKIEDQGFSFRFPGIDTAMKDLLHHSPEA